MQSIIIAIKRDREVNPYDIENSGWLATGDIDIIFTPTVINSGGNKYLYKLI